MSGPSLAGLGARQAMPAESFLEQTRHMRLDERAADVAGEGPDWVREIERQREQVAAIAPKLLEEELRPLLEWILDITLRKPVFLPNLGGQAVAYCALREGQNQVAWQILQAIAEGREERLDRREGL